MVIGSRDDLGLTNRAAPQLPRDARACHSDSLIRIRFKSNINMTKGPSSKRERKQRAKSQKASNGAVDLGLDFLLSDDLLNAK